MEHGSPLPPLTVISHSLLSSDNCFLPTNQSPFASR